MRMPSANFWAFFIVCVAVSYSLGWIGSTQSANASNSSATPDPPHGVDEWEEQDVLRFFSSCNVNASQMQAMRSLGLNGHSLMLLDNETLHHIGMAASDLQHLLAEIEILRQRVQAAPLDFWEWRAVNLRFNDMWLIPLSVNHRTILAWTRLRGLSDGPTSNSKLHTQGFYSFWSTWLLNPFFGLYRAMPDDSSFPAQLGRLHFSVLAFKDLYAIVRWLSVFMGNDERSHWREIISGNFNAAMPVNSRRPPSARITTKTVAADALKWFCYASLGQLVVSVCLWLFALFTYYILWYVTLRFVLHGFFYTAAYVIAPIAFTSSLYSASPLIREALLLFENFTRETWAAIVTRGVAFALRLFPDLVAAFNSKNKKLAVDRANLLQTSVQQLRALAPSDFAPQRTFRIDFNGECAIDVGGVFCEWHSANAKALCELALMPVTDSFGAPNGLYRLNPTINLGSANSSETEDHMWLFGCILGLSVVENLPIGVSVTPAFSKRLLGREDTLTLQDLAFELPTFEYLLNIQSSTLGDNAALQHKLRNFDIRFRTSSQRSRLTAAPAQPDADGELFSPLSRSRSPSEEVTSESFDEYVKLMIQRHLVDAGSRAMASLRSGFEMVVHTEARAALEAQSLVAALRGDVDLSHLKRVIKFSPKGSKQETMFMRFLENDCSRQDRTLFLRFATGRIALSNADGEGWLQVQVVQDWNTERLPEPHTCIPRMDMAPYVSQEQLSSKMKQAISETVGGGMFAI